MRVITCYPATYHSALCETFTAELSVNCPVIAYIKKKSVDVHPNKQLAFHFIPLRLVILNKNLFSAKVRLRFIPIHYFFSEYCKSICKTVDSNCIARCIVTVTE